MLESPAPTERSGSPGVPVTLDLRPVLAPLLARLAEAPPERTLSDATLANLWLFRAAHDWRFVDGPWPRLTGRAYDGLHHVLPLFPLHEAPATVVEELLAGHDAFFPLSDTQLARLDPARFAATASRDDADYLYPASNFADYAGAALQPKRNLARQFHAAHRVEARPYTPALQAEALAVLDGWLADKHKASGDADDAPCRVALSQAPALGLDGLLLFADGEPAGFALAEPLAPGVDVVRFAKGLARFKGVSQALFQQLARRTDREVRWLNFEQDLGLANFRRTKLSYRPAALLAKHRVTLRRD